MPKTCALLLAAVLLAVAGTAGAQPAPVVPAVLDLTLNTVDRGEIHVLLAGGEVWAEADTLVAAGLTHLAGTRRAAGGRTFVLLSSLDPRPEVVVDESALRLTIVAAPSLFGGTTLRFDTGRPDGVIYRRATSAFVNYGASWASGGSRGLSLESGVSISRALLTSSWFVQSGGRAARGMTAAIVDDTTRLRRYQVGDGVVATGPLGGSLQMAGVSVSRDFSLDPYFIRYPTTGLSGVVTTPSRVELYVNNQLVRSLQVQPGSYELANLALPTGAADTRVVVRDAFGGEQSFGGSYYVTTSVLARGLHQYQYAVGAERLRPFDTIWAYGRPIATGTHRVGLTDAVTLGGRAEIEAGLLSAGPTVTTRLGRFGALEASAAASRAGRGGVAGAVAYEYIGRPGGVSVAWRQASEGYETLTTRRLATAPVREVFASATTRLGSRVTSGLSWQSQDLRNGGDSRRRASLTTSFPVGRRASMFLSVSRAQMEGAWTTGAFASMTMDLGGRASTGVSVERQAGGTRAGVDFQRSAPVGPGVGYRAQLSGLGSDAQLLDADVRAQGQWAQADLRQTVVEGHRETWAQVNGALVAIGGRVLAARPVQDGFALVRVPDVAGVRAYVSHQEMGRTDRRGDLLVPNLLPYYGNRISIADADVPVDRALASRDVVLAPPYRGGAIAEFPAPRQRRVAGRLVAAGDAPALAGPRALDALVTVETAGGPLETWLGQDGQFYIEGLEPGSYRVRVVTGEDACEAALDVPATEAPVVQVGEVACAPAGGAGR